MRTIGPVVLSVLALAACEKDRGLSAKQSGTLRKSEVSLLEQLPGGNVGLFGGNYLRLQGYLQNGPFAKLMGAMEQVSPGMSAWSKCFMEGDPSKLQIMGAVSYTDGTAIMSFAMRGFGVAQVQACAQKANFVTHLDADGKFVSIEMPSTLGQMSTGYLVLADGSLLTRSALPVAALGGGAKPPDTTRADLEATVAAAARQNATTDAGLVAEAGRIDRDRAVWFVADLSSTPAADKVGLLRGWIDIGGGLSMDLNVQIKDAAMASQIASGIPEVKRQASMLGKDLAAVVRDLRYERKGDRFRFGIKISDAQLEGIMSQMGGMMGGGGGGGDGFQF